MIFLIEALHSSLPFNLPTPHNRCSHNWSGERHRTWRRDGPAAQPRCFPQSRSEQNAQLFNSGSMYRLDTCQVLIMHLAPTTEGAEIKRGVVLSLLRMGGKRFKSHLATSAPSNTVAAASLIHTAQDKEGRELFSPLWRTQLPSPAVVNKSEGGTYIFIYMLVFLISDGFLHHNCRLCNDH